MKKYPRFWAYTFIKMFLRNALNGVLFVNLSCFRFNCKIYATAHRITRNKVFQNTKFSIKREVIRNVRTSCVINECFVILLIIIVGEFYFFLENVNMF